jgi:uncharacterized protein (DUF433 family)
MLYKGLKCMAEIEDRGRGPEIKGTRITVYNIMEYEDESPSEIAKTFRIPKEAVFAALDYIEKTDRFLNKIQGN